MQSVEVGNCCRFTADVIVVRAVSAMRRVVVFEGMVAVVRSTGTERTDDG